MEEMGKTGDPDIVARELKRNAEEEDSQRGE
jgi:hypothetical protein